MHMHACVGIPWDWDLVHACVFGSSRHMIRCVKPALYEGVGAGAGMGMWGASLWHRNRHSM
jgi:hypothetical protein